jgi:hypothetical protein
MAPAFGAIQRSSGQMERVHPLQISGRYPSTRCAKRSSAA